MTGSAAPDDPLPAAPLRGNLLTINVGPVGVMEHGDREIVTAFHKTPVEGPLRLDPLGFPGDEHVYEHHGGPDQAVCVYPYEHYEYWRRRLGIQLPATAAFGENFTLTGLDENQVWLGDTYSVGEALVQVTQPRAPCYKIAARYRVPNMALFVQQEGFTGYLLRVLEGGDVQAGQAVTLLARQDHGITVSEANRIINVDKHDADGARRLLAIPGLPEALVPALERRIVRHDPAEDLDRLYGER